MREIKFRAYYDGKMQLWINPMNEHEGVKRYFTHMVDDPEVVLMQYTGLKDKNGKEIYEGDIVHVDGRKEPHLCEFVPKASGGRFQFTHPTKGVWSCFPNPDIRVIGNIYENSDLLQ